MIDSIMPDRPRRRGRKNDPQEQLPPHSDESERGALGCCVLDADALGECVTQLRTADVFYDTRHQIIYRAILGMFENNKPVDPLTLCEHLRADGQIDDAGGWGYVNGLPDGVPSAMNITYYAGIVRECCLRRRLIKVCVHNQQLLQEGTRDLDALCDQVERELLAVNEERLQAGNCDLRTVLAEVVERIEDYHRGTAQMLGLSTGFEYLDKMLLGMSPGEMIVIAGRPGLGKTSFGLQILSHLAVTKKIPCGMFTLEMSAQQLVARLLFQRARADFQRFRSGYLKNLDIPELASHAAPIAGAPLYLDETAGLNVLQLRARARRMHRRHGIRCLCVDYLQLLRGSRYYQNREQEVSEISAGLKGLAKELKIPVIVLAQLNREIERGGRRKPQLADLRESGAIEQDADVVAILYEPRLKDADAKKQAERSQDWSDNCRLVNLLVAKQRNGPTGDCRLVYHKKFMGFENLYENEPELPDTAEEVEE